MCSRYDSGMDDERVNHAVQNARRAQEQADEIERLQRFVALLAGYRHLGLVAEAASCVLSGKTAEDADELLQQIERPASWNDSRLWQAKV